MASIIGLTATRFGMSEPQKATFRSLLTPKSGTGTLHHGCCVGGDVDGHWIALDLRYRIVGHPPIYPTFRAPLVCNEMRPVQHYLTRNRHIVDESEMLIACPRNDEEEVHSGTWHTYRYALKKKKSVTLILRDGSTRVVR
jgi:hypothetical protein